MTDSRANPLWDDVNAYARELDATLTTPHFVAWLRANRPQLAALSDPDLTVLARECLIRFAYASSEER